MGLDPEELRRNREARAAQRRQQEMEQKKLMIKLIIALAVILAAGLVILIVSRTAGEKPDAQPEILQTEATQTIPTEAATDPTGETSRWDREATTVIHIKAAGDLNITDSVVASGGSAMGYDYTKAFMDVAPLLADADLTMMNFEGNVCGAPYGTASVSAPQELLQALRAAGVDILQTANSCSVNNGLRGLTSTLANIRAAGIEPVGTYATPRDYENSKGYIICNVQGVKVAVVAFTKGVGSRGMPTGNEDCVNLLYEDYATTYKKVNTEKINAILKAAEAEDPDITIALLHWGSEDNDSISKTQKSIISLMQKRGVDIIIGTHPHLVQQIDYDAESGNLVAYSLGDFYGDGVKGGTNYSILLDIEITMDNTNRDTRVTNYSITPIYTLKENECDSQRRVVRIQEAMFAYESNYVDRITGAAYSSMQTALKRIEERIKPPVEEED